MERFRLDGPTWHTSTPNPWVKSCPFWEILSPFKLLAQARTTGCLALSLRCFSAGNGLCVLYNWQFKRSEKDWINLNLTAARLQTALCVCLHYYLSGWKCPSAFTCPWKDERNNAVFNFGSYFKSALLRFFFLGKRQFDNFWHCLTSAVMLFLKLKQAPSLLLLLQVYTIGFCHSLALNSLHHP